MASNLTTIPAGVMVRGEYVLVPRGEYERLTRGRTRSLPTFMGYEMVPWNGKKYKVPVYQLHGRAAEKSDQEVKAALKEYREGKTIAARSVNEALRKYDKKRKENRV